VRTAAFCLILLAASLPAFAAHTVTVDQLQQRLAALRGKSDTEVVQAIADVQLAERLSSAREIDLEKALPGEKSRERLRAIADESQFRDPPSNEVPARPAPDIAAQRQIMGWSWPTFPRPFRSCPIFWQRVPRPDSPTRRSARPIM
jgi:hypothetical protein